MLIKENRPSKVKLFWCEGILLKKFLFLKMGVKINLRMIAKKYATEPQIGLSIKAILKPFGLTSLIRQRMSKQNFTKVYSDFELT